jgi:hypothetical protein
MGAEREKAAIKRFTVNWSVTMNPFEDMRIFCQVMDSGSFTAAADQWGCPSNLSVGA